MLQAGDRVGVMRNDDGTLHFFVNGVDQGLASCDVPPCVYGVIDLYGQAAQATIIDTAGNVHLSQYLMLFTLVYLQMSNCDMIVNNLILHNYTESRTPMMRLYFWSCEDCSVT